MSPQTLNQVFETSSFQPEMAQTTDSPNMEDLCPMKALRIYWDCAWSLRCMHLQLFICYGGNRRGNPVSKQRLTHWAVDSISPAYASLSHFIPGDLAVHSTRSMATSWAALRGVSVAEICEATLWATRCTFAKFYRVNAASQTP